MDSANLRSLLLILCMLAGCGNMTNDLYPSDSNKVPPVQPGTIGPAVGQNAPDFMLPDTLGNSITLSSVVTTTGVQGTVLYFTMWCPVCDSHMSHMMNATIPGFPAVRFFAVDYVSGSVAEARTAEASAGYAGTAFTVLADMQQAVLNLYQATMGTTVLIDRNGVIQMNEDYKDGTRLQTALTALP
jgi:peroxiredoxin